MYKDFSNNMNEDFSVEIDNWINKIKNKGKKTIIYSLSDINYKNRFEEMIKTFDCENSCFCMCSFDEETHEYFSKKDIPSILLNKTKNNFKMLVLVSKFLLSYALVLNGFDVILSEADIFWKEDIVKICNNYTKSVLVSQHSYCDEVNIGFIRFLSNQQTINFLKNLLDFIYSDNYGFKKRIYQKKYIEKNYCYCADQKLFDYSLRKSGNKDFTYHYKFNNICLEKLKSVPIDWEYLDCDILMHYPISFPNNHKGIHIWSGAFKEPWKQIEFAHNHNFYKR